MFTSIDGMGKNVNILVEKAHIPTLLNTVGIDHSFLMLILLDENPKSRCK